MRDEHEVRAVRARRAVDADALDAVFERDAAIESERSDRDVAFEIGFASRR